MRRVDLPERRFLPLGCGAFPPPISRVEYRSSDTDHVVDEDVLMEDEDQLCPKRRKLDLLQEATVFVKGTFSKALSNADRRGIKSRYLALCQTRCPKIDPMFKSKFASSSDTKRLMRTFRGFSPGCWMPLDHYWSSYR